MQVMAANGLSERVCVVQADVAMLQRGREVRPLGCNLAIADLFDAGTACFCLKHARSISDQPAALPPSLSWL